MNFAYVFYTFSFVQYLEYFRYFYTNDNLNLGLLTLSFGLVILPIIRFRKKYTVMASLSYIFISLYFFHAQHKVSNNYHFGIYCNLLMMFFDIHSSVDKKRNYIVVKIVQVMLLSCYFMSGLWKLRSLVGYFSLDFIYNGSLNHFAYSIGEGNGPHQFIVDNLINKFPIFFLPAMFLVLFFQLSVIYPCVTFKGMKYWGMAGIVFHILVFVFLGIAFFQCLPFLIIFFLMVETPKYKSLLG